MSHLRTHQDNDRPDHVAQGPDRQDLESRIDGLIRFYTGRMRHYDGSPITGEIREVWRQGAHVHVRELLSRMLEEIVKLAVRRAWRRDVVDEFRPRERGLESRLNRVDLNGDDLPTAKDPGRDEAEATIEVASAVESALDRLSWRQRARVEVFLYGGASIQQVAARFDVSTRTVYRALKEFKEGFEKALGRGRP